MLFNTPSYVLFLCIIVVGFYLLNHHAKLRGVRNAYLLIASYFFYACLQWQFCLLLLAITAINYACGWAISRYREKGLTWVSIGIVSSLAFLCYYKYTNFFIGSVNSVSEWMGYSLSLNKLKIILPVGISFFTFQALTYTIDVYRKKVEANKNFIEVALFVSFFPTVLSGPIERYRNLFPQLRATTPFNAENIEWGIKKFIWGLFKKMVIADRLAMYVDGAYWNIDGNSGTTLAIAAVLYSFQIYCDFSGYADMAIGSARILGFKIMENFNLPYFALSFKEFWKRWHISLTSWFTEYVYISLGGNRVAIARWILNISSVFLLSGLWHGANWSFIFWGAMHAILYLIEYFLTGRQKLKEEELRQQPWIYRLFARVVVFVGVTFAWVFFRIENIGDAWKVVTKICTDFDSHINMGISAFSTILAFFLLIVFIVIETIQYKKIAIKGNVIYYALLVVAISLFGVTSNQFVYFQF